MHQLELDLDRKRKSAPPRRGFRRRLREEWPSWTALVLLAQVTALGLLPALAESRRLSREEAEMNARHRADLQTQAELQLQLRAYDDPIYREREKKLLRAAANPLMKRE